MPFLTPYLFAAAVALSGLGGFFLGSKLKQGEWDASIVTAQTERGEALKAAAQAIAARDVKQQTIRERVIRETVEKPVYVSCRHDDSGLRDINAALTESADPSELSASDAAR